MKNQKKLPRKEEQGTQSESTDSPSVKCSGSQGIRLWGRVWPDVLKACSPRGLCKWKGWEAGDRRGDAVWQCALKARHQPHWRFLGKHGPVEWLDLNGEVFGYSLEQPSDMVHPGNITQLHGACCPHQYVQKHQGERGAQRMALHPDSGRDTVFTVLRQDNSLRVKIL